MPKKNKYADRIKEIRKIKGKDLLANPKNWRIHPEHQVKGLEAALGSVGKVGALLAWESPEGLMLLDGHGRVELNPEEEWTVLILDIDTEEEADKVLATFDTLTGLAEIDESLFTDVLASLDVDKADDRSLVELFRDTHTDMDINSLLLGEDIPQVTGEVLPKLPSYDLPLEETTSPYLLIEFNTFHQREQFAVAMFGEEVMTQIRDHIGRRLPLTSEDVERFCAIFNEANEAEKGEE